MGGTSGQGEVPVVVGRTSGGAGVGPESLLDVRSTSTGSPSLGCGSFAVDEGPLASKTDVSDQVRLFQHSCAPRRISDGLSHRETAAHHLVLTGQRVRIPDQQDNGSRRMGRPLV